MVLITISGAGGASMLLITIYGYFFAAGGASMVLITIYGAGGASFPKGIGTCDLEKCPIFPIQPLLLLNGPMLGPQWPPKGRENGVGRHHF